MNLINSESVQRQDFGYNFIIQSTYPCLNYAILLGAFSVVVRIHSAINFLFSSVGIMGLGILTPLPYRDNLCLLRCNILSAKGNYQWENTF